ncbi:DUF3261 domain-containing protein [Vibrio diazotrophicus]|uniref:DUF3261 domain-containing protein n=1 Tax=Vibrio diazotrophicus TaxID=685 RepID=UPI0022B01D35|nr:DUF3261 domain-containing protein [Vibrio diazotrophicus]MCZ4370971.1 DUF3261 domain-containing protein [Vibrio diazotrophicus]
MKWLTTLFACLWLSGCSLQPHTSSTQVEIDQDIWVELPLPSELGQSLNATQLISAQWQDEQGNTQTQQLPVQLQIDDQHIVLAGFSSWGTRLLSLDYNGENISTQVLSGLENTLPKPEQVLFNLMITLWPRSTWEAPLNKVRWSIIDAPHQRIIKNEAGEPVLIISYAGKTPLDGDIQFLNKPLDYSITIQTLSHQAKLTTSEQ